MEPDTRYRWHDWATRIRASVQGALAYSTNEFEIERCRKLEAIAHEILAMYTDAEFESVQQFLTGDETYATPKVDVRGVVFDDSGHILMVREKVDGKWSLPGGWADIGDSPSEAVVREIREEAGYIAEAVRLLGVLDRSQFLPTPQSLHIYKLFIRCEIVDRASEFANPETSAVDFFAIDNLPDLSTGRNTREQLQALAEFWQSPERPPLLN